ncbi:hypothetical protein CALCODRAFT_47319 [Calocera cornea HHB12733]|uniref:Uncharacterized protein n=1 Tax=Calocera cornea HHB12733 TaxID=1353952 RepID=A0A165J0V0_9BASI|nr:hypothetical protein CALCODRAFT_47319 [Calocera cornea HHB12733]
MPVRIADARTHICMQYTDSFTTFSSKLRIRSDYALLTRSDSAHGNKRLSSSRRFLLPKISVRMLKVLSTAWSSPLALLFLVDPGTHSHNAK